MVIRRGNVYTRASVSFFFSFLTYKARALLLGRLSVGVHAIGPTERSRFCITDREPLEKGAAQPGQQRRLFLGLIILFYFSRRETIVDSTIRS